MAKPDRKPERVMLIDGNALVHRAFHALPPLTSPSGELTNAVYGFTTILLKAIADLRPDSVAVAWDSSETKTFRHDLSDAYKATRQKADPTLYEQFPRVKQVVTTLGFPVIELPGYEADDIIGTLAKRDLKGKDVVIVTGDMDALQLVDENIKVYTMRRGFTDTIVYDPSAVKDRYLIRPDQVVDYKALRGDASDNIPGVPGIGEKSAIELLTEWDSLQNLYNHLDEVPEKWRKKLIEHKDSALLSQQLAQMALDAPISPDIDDWKVGEFDRDAAVQLFHELGFKSLVTKIPELTREAQKVQNQTKAGKQPDFGHTIIQTEVALTDLIAKLKNSKVIAIDTETDSLEPLTCGLVGISLAHGDGKDGYYIPLGHLHGEQLPLETVKAQLQPILNDPQIEKVAHNLKFDLQVLENCGITLSPPFVDTMQMGYILSAGSRAEKLDDMVFGEFGYEMQPLSDLIGTGRQQLSLAEVDIERAGLYGAEDAAMTLRLSNALLPKIKSEGRLEEVLRGIDMPLVPILSRMERRGIELDTAFLKKLSGEMETKIKSCEAKIFQLAGIEFNISSPAQLSEILFTTLQIPTAGVKKLQKGYSTAASELEKMRGLHPVVECIFEYRELTKLKSTYVDTLPDLIDRDGRVHTDYNQAVAATGRLSSNNPNLQNIPIRTELGRRVRQAFIASEGMLLVSADYSQLEIRIVAHLSGDPTLIKAFNDGEDIHTTTAALVQGVPENQVSPEMRRAAKAVNFGIMYGLSPHGLSVGTGMSREDATAFIDTYFARFPGLKRHMTETVEDARKNGYAESLSGRRRRLPELNSSNFIIRSQAERMAMNMPVQGTAADIMKLAMIDIDKEIGKKFSDSYMLLQVHDELVFEVKAGREKELTKFIRDKMSHSFKLEVPLDVDAKVGKNWSEMTELA